MTQELLLWVLFGLALGFVARKIYLDFSAKENCAKGCTDCDLDTIKQIK